MYVYTYTQSGWDWNNYPMIPIVHIWLVVNIELVYIHINWWIWPLFQLWYTAAIDSANSPARIVMYIYIYLYILHYEHIYEVEFFWLSPVISNPIYIFRTLAINQPGSRVAFPDARPTWRFGSGAWWSWEMPNGSLRRWGEFWGPSMPSEQMTLRCGDHMDMVGYKETSSHLMGYGI